MSNYKVVLHAQVAEKLYVPNLSYVTRELLLKIPKLLGQNAVYQNSV